MCRYSIIIPVRTTNDFLIENIGHLKSLSHEGFEVIIVTDDPENIDFGDTRFKSVSSGPIGPGEKRNIGAKNAAGDILAFLDDDAYPTSDWLIQADKIFENPQIYALGGPAVTPLDAEFLEKMSGRVLESWMTSAGTKYRHVPSEKKYINDYPTVNLFVKRDAFLSVGGFPKEFWPGEDTKLCLELVKKFGRNFFYSPLPVVFHHRRKLFAPHLKQISRYGRHRGQFARIYPENSRLLQYFIPSIFVLSLPLGFFLALLSTLIAKIYIFTLLVYLLLIFIESGKVCIKEKSIRPLVFVSLGVLMTHVIYGANFIIGFISRPKLELRGFDKGTGNYIGG